jgi:hypothetical protein
LNLSRQFRLTLLRVFDIIQTHQRYFCIPLEALLALSTAFLFPPLLRRVRRRAPIK